MEASLAATPFGGVSASAGFSVTTTVRRNRDRGTEAVGHILGRYEVRAAESHCTLTTSAIQRCPRTWARPCTEMNRRRIHDRLSCAWDHQGVALKLLETQA
jgi:hypothetical protein